MPASTPDAEQDQGIGWAQSALQLPISVLQTHRPRGNRHQCKNGPEIPYLMSSASLPAMQKPCNVI